jgi:hypothetical protein
LGGGHPGKLTKAAFQNGPKAELPGGKWHCQGVGIDRTVYIEVIPRVFIFREYLPLASLLPFLKPLKNIQFFPRSRRVRILIGAI